MANCVHASLVPVASLPQGLCRVVEAHCSALQQLAAGVAAALQEQQQQQQQVRAWCLRRPASG